LVIAKGFFNFLLFPYHNQSFAGKKGKCT